MPHSKVAFQICPLFICPFLPCPFSLCFFILKPVPFDYSPSILMPFPFSSFPLSPTIIHFNTLCLFKYIIPLLHIMYDEIGRNTHFSGGGERRWRGYVILKKSDRTLENMNFFKWIVFNHIEQWILMEILKLVTPCERKSSALQKNEI